MDVINYGMIYDVKEFVDSILKKIAAENIYAEFRISSDDLAIHWEVVDKCSITGVCDIECLIYDNELMVDFLLWQKQPGERIEDTGLVYSTGKRHVNQMVKKEISEAIKKCIVRHNMNKVLER